MSLISRLPATRSPFPLKSWDKAASQTQNLRFTPLRPHERVKLFPPKGAVRPAGVIRTPLCCRLEAWRLSATEGLKTSRGEMPSGLAVTSL
jgi:hypothetical protein